MGVLYNLIFGARGGVSMLAADGVTTVNVPAVVQVDGGGNIVTPSSSTGAGAQQVQGNVADGAADSGNSVKAGGVYNTAPTPATAVGQRMPFWVTQRGALVCGVGPAGGSNDGISTASGAFSDLSGTYRALATMNYLVSPSAGSFRAPGDSSGAFTAGASFWTESSAAQVGAATVTGSARSNGGAANGIGTRFNMFVAEAFADQAGTLYVDKSIDGTTWRQVGSIAAVVGTSVSLKVPISAANYRARYVNGATAQGAFLFTSGFTAA